jgi:diketogulonate reductase-like aldo/keto reductase
VHHIQELLEAFPQDPPAVNQIELSPFFQRASIVAECAKHDIVVESYSPLGKGAFVDLPELQDIAKKYGKTPSHILIRYVLQKDIVVLPKSVNPDRIKANADVYGFELDAEDMKTLDGFETGSGITWDRQFHACLLALALPDACCYSQLRRRLEPQTLDCISSYSAHIKPRLSRP